MTPKTTSVRAGRPLTPRQATPYPLELAKAAATVRKALEDLPGAGGYVANARRVALETLSTLTSTRTSQGGPELLGAFQAIAPAIKRGGEGARLLTDIVRDGLLLVR